MTPGTVVPPRPEFDITEENLALLADLQAAYPVTERFEACGWVFEIRTEEA